MPRVYGSPWRTPINEQELAAQAAQGGDVSRGEHQRNVEVGLAQYYEQMGEKMRNGELKKEEVAEHDLIHRINRLSPHENHEARWKRQHETAVEIQNIHNRMYVLARKYQEGRIDDDDYRQRWTKLKIREVELEKTL